MKKALAVTGAVLVLLIIIGFYGLNAYIYAEKQGDGSVDRYRGTLSGEVVCLPPADEDGPTTRECALGLRTDAGEHYALDLALLSQEHPPLDAGMRIGANGMITPIGMLSGDRWQRYDVAGIFSVTDSLVSE